MLKKKGARVVVAAMSRPQGQTCVGHFKSRFARSSDILSFKTIKNAAAAAAAAWHASGKRVI